MAKEQFIIKEFRKDTLQAIAEANVIIAEYLDDDLQLTVRQLYYQFVSRGLIENKQTEYKRLINIVSDGRLAGMIDWYAIEDRTRHLESNIHWRDPGQIVRAASRGFQLDHWKGQPYRVEVWIEKEALTGVIDTICGQLDVAYFACKGYVSQSEMYSASKRLLDHCQNHQIPIIVHLGDHDPSGIDMTRDIIDRMQTLGVDLSRIEVNRIALNHDQVIQYNPPPNPAKLSDSRANGYIAEYGTDSWELDALEPRVLRQLIQDTVEKYRDEVVYNETMIQEKEYKDVLKKVEDNWETL